MKEMKEVEDFNVYYNETINKFAWFFSNSANKISPEGPIFNDNWQGTLQLEEDCTWKKLVDITIPFGALTKEYTYYVSEICSYLKSYNSENPFTVLKSYNSENPFTVSFKDFTTFLNALNYSYLCFGLELKTQLKSGVKEVVKEEVKGDAVELEYRMYGFVLYQLNGIQSGIQFGHGVVEYANKYSKTKEYEKWSKHDKTFIVLNGGTTNNNPLKLGTLNKLMDDLNLLGINYTTFTEPDLGDQITSINFLLDERAWNKEKYPYSENDEAEERLFAMTNISESFVEAEQILECRNFISRFKLASN